jgi:hypothetical protein
MRSTRIRGAQPRTQTLRRRRKVLLSVFLALAVSATVTGIALSAEVVTAELDGVTNQVTVEQGGSANFTISLSATGNVACGSSHTASVHTVFSVNSAGAVSSSTFGAAKTFTASSVPGCTNNAPITWSGAPAPQTVAASVSADASAPLGDHTIVLKASNGNVALTDSNGQGGKLSDDTGTTLTIHVVAPTPPANSAPTVSFDNPPTSANEGDTKTFNFTVSDSDSGETFSVVSGYPDCGSGGSLVSGSLSTNASGGSFQCSFADGPASPSVAIQVKDSKNAVSNIATAAVGVANVAPTVTLSGTDGANEGDTKTYTYTINDPGDDPNPTVTESCGAGTRTDTAAANSFDCTFPDGPSSSTVKVTADDGDPSNNLGEDTIDVLVANVAPTVSALDIQGGSGTACLSGKSVTLKFSVSDPGDDSLQNGVIDWGDSATTSFSSSPVSEAHTYTGAGSWTIKVDVQDSDSAPATEKTGQVALSYSVSGILQPINYTGPRSLFKLGSTIPVKITVKDCAQNPVTTLSPQVRVGKQDSLPDGSDAEPTSTATPTEGTAMRYDASGQQYIYNLSTKSGPFAPYSTGDWYVRVYDASFGSASPVQATFSLKK